MNWEKRHKDFIKNLSESSALFLAIGVLIDLLVSYTVFKYDPTLFLSSEKNTIVVSWLQGNSGFPFSQVLLNTLPPILLYITYRGYMTLESKKILDILCILVSINLVFGISHIYGATTWLF